MATESPKNVDSDPKTNLYEYPRKYFEVQVQFASKYSAVTGTNLADCLLEKTALYRRINGKNLAKGNEPSNEWTQLTQKLEGVSSDRVTDIIYAEYQKQPHSIYVPPEEKQDDKHFGPFGYDYHPKNGLVKIHFTNTIRGPRSALAREFQLNRTVDLTMMFTSIRRVHPEAKTVIGGSWLYNLDSYRRLFPESFVTNMKKLIPPEMSFQGNSIWGQFLNSSGGAKEDICTKFVQNLATVKTENDLVNAFPYPVLQPKTNITDFYNKFVIVNI